MTFSLSWKVWLGSCRRAVATMFCISLVGVLVAFWLRSAMQRIQFMEGFAALETDKYCQLHFCLATFGLPILLLLYLIVYGIVVLASYLTHGKRVIMWGLLLFAGTVGIICAVPCGALPTYVYITNGIHDLMQSRADIDAIRKWLHEIDFEGSVAENGHIWLDERKWPGFIRELNPRDVIVSRKDSRKYVRLEYGTGVQWPFGLMVMEEVLDVPLDDVYETEYRLPLNDHAFVWHRLRSD